MRAQSKLRRSCLALAALGAAACTPDFDKIWQVEDLRLLAIRAEPPEVLVPAELLLLPGAIPSVRVDALVVDPRDPQATVRWQAIACTPEEDRCDEDAALRRRVHPREETGAEWAISTVDRIGFDFQLDLELAGAALAADPFKGYGGLPIVIELRILGDEEVVGIKRLVYGIVDPPEKRPNQNPRLAAVKSNDAAIPASWVVNKESAQVLLPEAEPGAKEPYVVRTFEGGTRELEEYLSYAFYVTAGELSHAQTGGEPTAVVVNKKVDDITSEWSTPLEPGTERVWVVVRDDRGGVGWQSFVAQIE